MYRWFIVLSFLYCGQGLVSGSGNLTDAERLHRILFQSGYEKNIRPAIEYDKPVSINVTLTPNTVIALDEVMQSFTLSGWLTLVWTDPRLSWDSSLYGNISRIYRSFKDIWVPDVTLINYYDSMIDFDFYFLLVTVYSNGTVMWMPGDVFKCPCSMDVTMFPFDRQTCRFYFGSWSYTEDYVSLIPTANISTRIRSNAQWEIEEVGVFKRSIRLSVFGSRTSAVKVQMTLKRQPAFCFLNYVLPVILLAILNVFIFQLPNGSEEKLSFSLTILLSFAVYMSFLSDIMPKTSDTIPYFSLYVTYLVCSSALIVLTSVINLKVSNMDQTQPVPICARCFVRAATLLKRACQIVPQPRQRRISDTAGESKMVEETKSTTVNKEEEDKITWKDVGREIDFVCFRFFFLSFCMTTTTLFVVITDG